MGYNFGASVCQLLLTLNENWWFLGALELSRPFIYTTMKKIRFPIEGSGTAKSNFPVLQCITKHIAVSWAMKKGHHQGK